MKALARGQRVLVQRCEGLDPAGIYELGGAPGVVARTPRSSDSWAWVRLDARSELSGAHQFPADAPGQRGQWVLAYAEDCDVPPDITGRHGHSCPVCYEAPVCTIATCTIEPDLGFNRDGFPMGSHAVCDTCKAAIEGRPAVDQPEDGGAR